MELKKDGFFLIYVQNNHHDLPFQFRMIKIFFNTFTIKYVHKSLLYFRRFNNGSYGPWISPEQAIRFCQVTFKKEIEFQIQIHVHPLY